MDPDLHPALPTQRSTRGRRCARGGPGSPWKSPAARCAATSQPPGERPRKSRHGPPAMEHPKGDPPDGAGANIANRNLSKETKRNKPIKRMNHK